MSLRLSVFLSMYQRCHDFSFYRIDQVHRIMVDPIKSIDSVSTLGRFFVSWPFLQMLFAVTATCSRSHSVSQHKIFEIFTFDLWRTTWILAQTTVPIILQISQKVLFYPCSSAYSERLFPKWETFWMKRDLDVRISHYVHFKCLTNRLTKWPTNQPTNQPTNRRTHLKRLI